MSDQYVGEIRMFTGDYAPQGWALCDGRQLPIRQYEALYKLIGVRFGGDGRTTFALPDLRTRYAAAASTARAALDSLNRFAAFGKASSGTEAVYGTASGAVEVNFIIALQGSDPYQE